MSALNTLYGILVLMMVSQLVNVYVLNDTYSGLFTWVMLGFFIAASMVYGSAKNREKDT